MWNEWTEVCNPQKPCSDDLTCQNIYYATDDENIPFQKYVGYSCSPPETCEWEDFDELGESDKITWYLDEKNIISIWCKTEDLNLVAPGTTDYNFLEQIGQINGAS